MTRSHRSFKKSSSKRGSTSRTRQPVSSSKRQGQVIELMLDRFSYDGRGIGKFEGKTCFVEGGLPNERVQARIRSEQSKFIEAQLVSEPLEASSHRVQARCEHYGHCGGCNLQHLEATQQITMKSSELINQFQRQAKIVPESELLGLTSSSWGYRRAARLSIKVNKDGSWHLGYRRRADNSVVGVKDCPILVPALQSILPKLQVLLAEAELYKVISHIELGLDETKPFMVCRIPRSYSEIQRQQLLAFEVANELSVWLQVADNANYTSCQGEEVDPQLSFELGSWDITLSYKPSDFIQVNAEVNEKMIAQALDLLDLDGSERVLDLFCGIGNFTLPLAKHAKRVIGIEAIEAMVARGRFNAEQNGLTNVEFVAADLESDVSRASWAREKFDVLVLDPPRAGARSAMNWIAQLQVDKILYVSCNPATFARDAQMIEAMGYKLASLGAMDMFPQTAHVEAMGLFVR